jgi:hypothetical protein
VVRKYEETGRGRTAYVPSSLDICRESVGLQREGEPELTTDDDISE